MTTAEVLYRPLSTVLDADRAPAPERAALYHERWEIETALDELKTHLRDPRIVLRGKTPELVRQEFWGLILAHFAIHSLMHDAARQRGDDPDRLSYLPAVPDAPDRTPTQVAAARSFAWASCEDPDLTSRRRPSEQLL